jgi:uncharacterized membrane protein
MDDRRMDETISSILRLGVSAAALLVVFGGVIYLRDFGRMTPQYRTFHAARFRPGLMQAGLFLLILTPVARVLFSVFAFAREKDTTYVVITLIVLALLAIGWLTGHGA